MVSPDVVAFSALLPPRQRRVTAWSSDRYRPEGIAADLHQSPEAVRSNPARARRALAARLGQEGARLGQEGEPA